MLVLVTLLMALSTVVVAANRRDVLSLYLCGLSGSFVVMMCGVVTYVAKMGGYNTVQRLFLFLSSDLQLWLQGLPVPLGTLGYLVALGRSVYPYFLLCIGLYHSNLRWVRRRENLVRWLHLLGTLALLVYYFPPVFRKVVGGRFWVLVIMRQVCLGWIVVTVLAAFALLLQEYFAITSPYFKRTCRFVVLALVSISVLYGMYAIQDPGQIYNFYVSEYIRLGSLNYLRTALSSGWSWLPLAGCTVFFVALGSFNMIHYSRLSQSEAQEDTSLQRKFDTASMGASVFVHSIKNQLLAARVAHKKLQQELESPQPDLDQVRSWATCLREMNNSMLERMEELYRSIKVSYIALVPVKSSEVVAGALGRLAQKYPDAKVQVCQNVDALILADRTHLAEALYNLLTNAYEAATATGREARVELLVQPERLWLDFIVRDNGPGISRAEQKKIFDPFYTSRNTNTNWGMGLYYVRQIVKSHLGHLQIKSAEGKGSSFIVMLPRYVPGKEKHPQEEARGE
ncbi:MAG TPA: HAMP domain-containing histidine kinase [Candidatus Fournierella merdigallinarum]|nr:HAMP domain-containing histidine kinase [Candidatus Fournierella merdigallinarum]